MNKRQRVVLKGILVFVYTLIGASIAVAPEEVAKLRDFRPELDPHLEVPASILLGAVLLAAMWLGWRGKGSASWAVIAYGTLSVGLLRIMAIIDWYNWDGIQYHWQGMVIATLIVCTIAAVGLNAAVRNRWRQMIAFSVLIFLALFASLPALLYGKFVYCHNHNIYS